MNDKKSNLADRLGAAAKAKQALLARARAMSPANDPEFAERQAVRLAASLAREAREAERKAARLAERERLAAAKREAEAAARAAAETAEREAREAALADQAARELAIADEAARNVALEAERKAARDARYAARKANVKR